MWMKTRFAQWEVEGQVRERVNRALTECEQGRLEKTARGDPARRMLGRILTTFSAGLAWLPVRAEAALLSLRGCPDGGQDRSKSSTVERSPSRTAIELSPKASSPPLHR